MRDPSGENIASSNPSNPVAKVCSGSVTTSWELESGKIRQDSNRVSDSVRKRLWTRQARLSRRDMDSACAELLSIARTLRRHLFHVTKQDFLRLLLMPVLSR